MYVLGFLIPLLPRFGRSLFLTGRLEEYFNRYVCTMPEELYSLHSRSYVPDALMHTPPVFK